MDRIDRITADSWRRVAASEADSPLRGISPGWWAFSTAVAAALAWLWWGEPVAWFAPVLSLLAVGAAVVDWRTLRVPNVLTLTGLAATCAVAIPLVGSGAVDVYQPAIGAAVMAGPLLATHLTTRGRTPGLGDVKLSGVFGAVLGVISLAAVYAALLVSLLFGAGFGVWYQARMHRRAFPFAPSLSTATIVVVVAAGFLERGASTR